LPISAVLVRFTPDGRGLLAADAKGVGVWDLASRKRVVWHPAHTTVPGDSTGTFVNAWDVTADGRTLATGHADGTILLWALTPPERPPAVPALVAADLDRLWTNLAGADAARAYRAGWELAARPDQAVGLVRGKVAPLPAADGDAVAKLVAQLGAEEF